VLVNWTEPALNALDGIDEYISRDAPVYAQHFIEQLMASVDRLEIFPLSGRTVPEAERDDIREIIFQHYRIIYWVISDEQIDIIGVVRVSRDLSDRGIQPWAAQ
jgi:addiction module RelE/StbE family toxin